MNNSESEILVVEDNEDDVFFMRRALKAALPTATVHFVSNGRAALDFLHATGEFAERAGAPLPARVFLDLKLPYVHGLEVLTEIRRHPRTQHLSIFILTSSSEPPDRSRAQALGIQGYMVKPPTRELLLAALTPTTGRGGEPAPSPPQEG